MGKAVREPEVFWGGGISGRLWKGGQLRLQCWDSGMQPALLLKTKLCSLSDGSGMSYMSGFLCFNEAPPPLLSSYP